MAARCLTVTLRPIAERDKPSITRLSISSPSNLRASINVRSFRVSRTRRGNGRRLGVC
jgi:hypothetical protein